MTSVLAHTSYLMVDKAFASMALKMAGNKRINGHWAKRAQPGVCSHVGTVRNGTHFYFNVKNFITENVSL